VGKTDVLNTFFSRRAEIINADSMQVYRYMDIGTAKPTDVLLRATPHHLISIVDPDYQFSVGEFIRRAEDLVRELSVRNVRPVLAGGTAYYFKTFAFGISDAPKSNRRIRRQLDEWIEEVGLETAYSELLKVDPDYAAQIGSSDRARILRALEVFRLSELPLSRYRVPHLLRRDYRFLFLGLYRPRQELYDRIERRVDRMFEEGLIEEVKNLLARGFGWDTPGMRGIGYQEFSLLQRGCLTTEGVKDLIKRNSRHYAKRQITFFKSLPGVKWYHADDLEGLSKEINQFYS
jgi:tRNA dimethylallyltransferase